MDFLRPEAFFDLGSFEHRTLFADCTRVWEALSRIPAHLQAGLRPNVAPIGCFGKPLPETLVLWRGMFLKEGFEILGGDPTKGKLRVRIEGTETDEASVLYAGCVLWDEEIHVGPGVVVEPGALVKGPTIIDGNTEVRQGAYIRGKCILGRGCVVGHTTEMKSSVMLNGAKAGHFAYIGDSILGNFTNLGAGAKLANLKIGGAPVVIKAGGQKIDTGLRKFGAIIGDGVEIGCNAVTNPGTLLGRNAMVLPVSSVRAGYYPPESMVR
jgi:carbonic anhydrase/acetyltransferase-like protein (isoleucine patch superfamily)